MSRFFVPKEAVKGNEILVEGDEAHHILDVMRLKELDKIVAFDGTGKEYVGFIKNARRNALVVEIVETRHAPSHKNGLSITLIQAIPKKDKMSCIVEKATELGADSIIPVVTKRTIPDWNESKRAANTERWRKIAKEASKQCGRSDIPNISEVRNFSELMKGPAPYNVSLIATLGEGTISLRDAVRDFKEESIAIAIGPEGDFTIPEINAARKAGFKAVSLGRNVLKSDTAGLAALAILNYELTSQ